jgi:chemotaxis response regulator CheB
MRIGIVNDVPTVAEALRRAVLLKPDCQVAWVAYDGAQAVAECARDRPDVILMDLVMPGMNGVAATRRIMAETPCAILIVTASVGANASGVFEALGHGAVDAVDTPTLDPNDLQKSVEPLLHKLEHIAEQITASTSLLRVIQLPVVEATSLVENTVVAIGASAGGPGALAKLLSGLPRNFPAAVVIVQHIDERFSAGLADWLDQQSCHAVRLAQDGDRPMTGTVLLARGHAHIYLNGKGELCYMAEPREAIYRPSIDVFMQSVCQYWQKRAIGVLLTGMGRDGAVGLKTMRDKGYHTIAQDEASSTVYGMPKAAARLNAADQILPLEQIAPRLVNMASWSGRLPGSPARG